MSDLEKSFLKKSNAAETDPYAETLLKRYSNNSDTGDNAEEEDELEPYRQDRIDRYNIKAQGTAQPEKEKPLSGRSKGLIERYKNDDENSRRRQEQIHQQNRDWEREP